jgi:hypothetical protein
MTATEPHPNDDFLRAGRTRPRPEFTASLYRRLGPASAEPLPTHRRFFPMSLSRFLAPKRLALGLLALVAALALTLVASPVARAQLAGVLRTLGGVSFNEVDAHPGAASGAPVTVPHQTLTIAEAQSSLGFDLSLPAWAPSGYALQNDVTVFSFDNGALTFARLAWYGDMGQVIGLQVESPGSATWQVGPDSLEETTVNGQPAAVLRGMWNADTSEWVRTSAITLSWDRGAVTYHLSSSDGSTSAQTLVQMAESIP